MRIGVLEESVKSCEVECKASRETVLRLVAELDRERRKAASSAAALDSLKVVLTQLLKLSSLKINVQVVDSTLSRKFRPDTKRKFLFAKQFQ